MNCDEDPVNCTECEWIGIWGDIDIDVGSNSEWIVTCPYCGQDAIENDE